MADTNADGPAIDPTKDVLRRYLLTAHEALRWKLEGLSEYDARRPYTPTGTNLLGLVKHYASVALGYLGDCFGRPHGIDLPWLDHDSEPNADMWATADESRSAILSLLDAADATADATIEALALDAVGEVPWWPEDRRRVTLHRILIHLIAEANRHAGHADIIREMIDGATGLHPDRLNLPDTDEEWWTTYRDRVDEAARTAPSD